MIKKHGLAPRFFSLWEFYARSEGNARVRGEIRALTEEYARSKGNTRVQSNPKSSRQKIPSALSQMALNLFL